MTSQASSRLLTPVCIAALMASCTIVNWPSKMMDETPVRSIERPENYIRGNFGSVIVPAWRPAHDGEEDVRYVAASGGGDTPTGIYRLSRGGDIGGGRVFTYALDIRSSPYLGYYTGMALASAAEWDYLPSLDRACVIVGEPGLESDSGGFSRYCLDTLDGENPRRVPGAQFRTLAPDVPTRLGRSVAVLPAPGTDPPSLRYLVLGAVGSVHLMNNNFEYAVAPSLEVDTTIEVPDYGVAVAAGRLGAGWPAWVAVGSESRVYVWGIWDDPATTGDPDPDHVWLQACWESPGRNGFGTRIWAGDIDGDGRDDLAIGAGPLVEARTEELVVVDASEFWDALPPDPYPTIICRDVPESTVFACGDFPDRGVTCGAYQGFGSSFAVGDLDGEGSSEVVIGVPGVMIEGKARAGAVLIYDPSNPTAPVSALRDATPESGTRLGTSVAVSEIAGQDEVIAGSPGSNEVFVFYCSGVGNDTPEGRRDVHCR